MITNIIKKISNNRQQIYYKYNNIDIGHVILKKALNNSIYLENIFVKEKFRNKNFGSLILGGVEKYCKSLNINKISLVAWNPTNTTNNVTDFYLKNNYTINDEFKPTIYDNGDIIYDIIPMEKILNN